MFGWGPILRIVLDGDPVAKGRPRFSPKTGAVHTPEKTLRYEDRLAWAAQAAMIDRDLFTVALAVEIAVYKSVPESWSTKKKALALEGKLRPTVKPDLDNYAKCVDALNKKVWTDDSLIVDLTVAKWYSDRPRLEIFIRTA